MSKHSLPAALLLVASVVAAPSWATVPSPANSTLPACYVACPMGDIPVTVTVRDLANNVVPSSSVVLDFSQCPGAYICPQQPSDRYTVNMPARAISGVTDASGKVTFALRVGGTCAGARIFADGVLLGTLPFKSPDQNGDGVVIEPDYTIFLGKLGSGDVTADFNCSGTVDNPDLITMNLHGSHSCIGIVDPATPRSWGSLKLLYR